MKSRETRRHAHFGSRRAAFAAPAAVAAAAVMALTSSSARGTVWDRGAGNGNWSNFANWDTNIEPTSSDPVFFPTPVPGGNSAITLSSGEVGQGIIFQDSYQLGGGSFTFGAGGGYLTPVAGTLCSVSSSLQGTIGLTKGGPGTLLLSGTNTFTGTVNVAFGTLVVTHNAALGQGGNPIALNATLRTSGTFSMNRVITPGAGGTAALEVFSGIVTNSAGLAANASPLQLTGDGILELNGASTRTGTTYIGSARLRVGNNTALGGGLVTVDGPGQLDIAGGVNSSTPVSLGNNATLLCFNSPGAFQSGVVTVADGAGVQVRLYCEPAGGEMTVGSNVSTTNLYRGGSGAMTLVDGPGIVVMSSVSNTYSGSWTVLPGATLRAYSTDALGTGTDPVVLHGGTFTVFGDNARDVQMNDGSAVRVTFSANPVSGGVHTIAPGAAVAFGGYSGFSGTLTVGDAPNDLTGGGSGSLITIDRPGNVRLNHSSDYVGDWLIKGSLQVSGDNCFGNPANTITLDGGSISPSAPINSPRSLLINSGGGSVSGTPTNPVTFGNVSGVGMLNQGSSNGNLTVNHVRTGGLHVAGKVVIAPNGTNTGTSRVGTLSFSTFTFSTAKLDLTDNDLIIDYAGTSPAGVIEAWVASGYNVTGDWLGKGITSSVAAADGNFTLAIADNALLAAPFGTAQGGPLFSGQDVDLTTILIKFTHRADINLDGLVTPDDSAIFGGSYDESITSGHSWAAGDMNYDGVCTPDDAAIFGGAYDESLASLPEPASITCLAVASWALSRRRHCRAC